MSTGADRARRGSSGSTFSLKPDRRSHEAVVDAWMTHVPAHPVEGVVTALEQMLHELWRRADVMVGQASLVAVMDRVLHDAAMRFPIFGSLTVDAGGVHLAKLRAHAEGADAQQVHEGTRFILTQTLTVIGNLTMGMLTPALHAALAPDGGGASAAEPRRVSGETDIRPAPDIAPLDTSLEMLETGVANLDLILGQGLPRGTVSIVTGPPGSGKTILAQQFCFHNATPERPALYVTTLSEPVAKTLRYMGQFSFFDRTKIGTAIHLVDLGEMMRAGNGVETAAAALIEHVKRLNPGIVVVDSFKSFDDLNASGDRMRKFGYQVAVQLMAWETTALLLGEYAPGDYKTKPFFSIADGLISLSHEEASGEWQRFIQVHKMRGISHSRDPHAFAITRDGLRAFTPRLTIKRSPEGKVRNRADARLKTGITGLDELIGEGIPHGSSLLLAGGPGTGKTVLLLDFIYQGAVAGEKGVFFSFEETPERLRASARGLGWDLDREVDRGMIEIVCTPQPDIMLEADLVMMQEKVEALGARRVAIDSVSVFLHKVGDKRVAQEKTFQLATIVQNAGAVGFFATDIPYGMDHLSRFGIEETIVDGVVLLTATEDGLARHRFLEVYKLRNTAHANGRHEFVIGAGKVAVIPRIAHDASPEPPRRNHGAQDRRQPRMSRAKPT